MPHPLPPESHDLIVDFLHDEEATLKACCVVSKSWVPRVRRHLFACIEFQTHPSHIHLWMKAFPDPSNSPARYTCSLIIHGSLATIAPGVNWIRAFSTIVNLRLYMDGESDFSPILLHGFSHTLKSLHLSYKASLPPSEVFGFVCSFPLLEDPSLVPSGGHTVVHEWDVPPTSPKFTGTLNLRTSYGVNSVVQYLTELPGGPRFTKIEVFFTTSDAESVTNLVSNCSETLRSLSLGWLPVGQFSLLASAVGQCLTTAMSLVREPPLINLSSLTKLEDVVLGWGTQDVRWITMALQTVKSKNLRQITIDSHAAIEDRVTKAFLGTWRDLDHVMFRLWTSRSVRSKIKYRTRRRGRDLGARASTLLPELTGRGAVDLVDAGRTSFSGFSPPVRLS